VPLLVFFAGRSLWHCLRLVFSGEDGGPYNAHDEFINVLVPVYWF